MSAEEGSELSNRHGKGLSGEKYVYPSVPKNLSSDGINATNLIVGLVAFLFKVLSSR